MFESFEDELETNTYNCKSEARGFDLKKTISINQKTSKKFVQHSFEQYEDEEEEEEEEEDDKDEEMDAESKQHAVSSFDARINSVNDNFCRPKYTNESFINSYEADNLLNLANETMNIANQIDNKVKINSFNGFRFKISLIKILKQDVY
jgi:hypothetical protein